MLKNHFFQLRRYLHPFEILFCYFKQFCFVYFFVWRLRRRTASMKNDGRFTVPPRSPRWTRSWSRRLTMATMNRRSRALSAWRCSRSASPSTLIDGRTTFSRWRRPSRRSWFSRWRMLSVGFADVMSSFPFTFVLLCRFLPSLLFLFGLFFNITFALLGFDRLAF